MEGGLSGDGNGRVGQKRGTGDINKTKDVPNCHMETYWKLLLWEECWEDTLDLELVLL